MDVCVCAWVVVVDLRDAYEDVAVYAYELDDDVPIADENDHLNVL